MLDALVALELSKEKVRRQFGTDREMSGTRRRRLLFGRKRHADASQAVPRLRPRPAAALPGRPSRPAAARHGD
jgi:hypothetical protein